MPVTMTSRPALRLDAEAAHRALPDHAVDGGLVVLERQIDVARGVAIDLGHLAAQPHVAEAVLQGALEGERQLGDRQGRVVVARRRPARLGGAWRRRSRRSSGETIAMRRRARERRSRRISFRHACRPPYRPRMTTRRIRASEDLSRRSADTPSVGVWVIIGLICMLGRRRLPAFPACSERNLDAHRARLDHRGARGHSARMNILLVGSGGREHALAWKMRQSPLVDRLVCAPGNPGIAKVAECVADVRADDAEGLARLAREMKAGLVVVGPEVALAGRSGRPAGRGRHSLFRPHGQGGAAGDLQGLLQGLPGAARDPDRRLRRL